MAIKINETVITSDNNTINSGVVLYYAGVYYSRKNKGLKTVNIASADIGANKIVVTNDLSEKLKYGAPVKIDGDFYSVLNSTLLTSGDTEVELEESLASGIDSGSELEYTDIVETLEVGIIGFESEKFSRQSLLKSDKALKLPDNIKTRYYFEVTEAQVNGDNLKTLIDNAIKSELIAAGYTGSNLEII